MNLDRREFLQGEPMKPAAHPPLSFNNPLHGNPSGDLLFSETVSIKDGSEIPVPCPRATRAMVALMDMEAVIGGAASHYGGPAAFAETMSAVFGLMFARAKKQGKDWKELFHFVNDAGHCENGLYALKANYGLAGLDLEALKHFRSVESPLTGHGEAHLFPQGVYISNGPLGSGLPQAQGLAVAEALSGKGRTTVTAISDGACMEGEAKEAFAAIPGLAAKGQLGPFLCVVSDNNTKLSGRIDQDSFSMTPSFASLGQLGWEVTKVEEGHNLQSVVEHVEAGMDKAQASPQKPQLLWIQTVKGKGVQSAENSPSGGHGFPLKGTEGLSDFVSEIYGGGEVPPPLAQWVTQLSQYKKPETTTASPVAPKIPGERMKAQVGVAKALIDQYEKGYPVVSISADLQGSTGVAPFRKKFPEASFEVGVAESNMISMGVGLSKQGYIPVVDTFAQFAVTKGALPLIMSGLSGGPVIGVFSHTGFQDAADGASHQCLTYLAMMCSLPHVDVTVLSCAGEAEKLVGQAIENFAKARKENRTPNSHIFFLGREVFLENYVNQDQVQLGKAQVLSDTTSGCDQTVSLLAVGPMIESALEAQMELKEKGIGSLVINPSSLQPLDMDTLKEQVQKTGHRCVTIEDHRLTGGMGALLAHGFQKIQTPVTMKSLGIGNAFGRSAYKAKHLYDLNGMGVFHIVEAAQSFFK